MASTLVFFVFTLLSLASVALSTPLVCLKNRLVTINPPQPWRYYGCQRDDRNAPTLASLGSTKYLDPIGMTLESCINFCDNAGYIYAGIHSQTCSCGNVLKSTSVTEQNNDCSAACSGNATQSCGGMERLSLYKSGALPKNVVTNPGIGRWTSLGCYTDSDARTLSLGISVLGGSAAMSVRLCTAACEGRSYSYAGLGFGGECWCGDALLNGGAASIDGGCDMACNGNATEFCGGAKRLNLYQIDDGVSSTKSGTSGISSMASSRAGSAPSSLELSSRALFSVSPGLSGVSQVTTPPSPGVASPSITSSGTFSISRSSSVQTQSVPASSSVPTLPSSSIPSALSSSSTAFSFKASFTEVAASSTVFSSSSGIPPMQTAGWEYLGCYTDSRDRTLVINGFIEGGPEYTTQEACQSACLREAGGPYIYAGLEFGGQCYCGNELSNGGGLAPDGNVQCNMACTGNKMQICGGRDRLTLFRYNNGTSGASSVVIQWSSGQQQPLSSSSSALVSSSRAFSTSSTSSSSAMALSSPGIPSTSSIAVSTSLSRPASIASSPVVSAATSSASSLTSILPQSSPSPMLSSPASSFRASSVTPSSASSAVSSSQPAEVTSSSLTPASKFLPDCPNGAGSVYTTVNGTFWLIECGIEYGGFDMTGTGQPAPSFAACINRCSSRPGCVLASYLVGNICYEKSKVGTLTPNKPTIWIARLVDSPPPSSVGSTPLSSIQASSSVAGSSLRSSAQSSASASTVSFQTLTPRATSSPAAAASSSSSANIAAVPSGIPAGWQYSGCYEDNVQGLGRSIFYGQPDSQTLTPQSCIQLCTSLGYSVAGLEFSTQCFCDNYIRNSAPKLDESECNMACSGDPTQVCGAGNRLNVYYTGTLTIVPVPTPQKDGIPGSWQYIGCVTDTGNPRTFAYQTILEKNNSATECLTRCAAFGFNAGAMEYGQECYCGDYANIAQVGATLAPEGGCSTPCPGNPGAICGSGNRMTTYVWNGTQPYSWDFRTGNAAGQYQFLIGGVVVPLITQMGINGKVAFLEKYGTGVPNATGAYEFDPFYQNDFDNAWRPMHVKTDIFCSASLTLPDKGGRMLNIGGWSGESTYGIRLYLPDGSNGTPGVNDWQEDKEKLTLQKGRWYPSAMVMTNGSILVVGGETGSNGPPEPTIELLPRVGPAIEMEWLRRTDPNNLYPFLAITPSGGIAVFYYNEARILSQEDFSTLKMLPPVPGAVNNPLGGRTYPLEGAMTLLPQKYPYTDMLEVLLCGGSTPFSADALDNCVSIKPDAPDPKWTIERMPTRRVMPNIVALADGTYLILNGGKHGVAGFGLGKEPNLNAVLYDSSKPVGSRMSVMANTTIARLYHSEAILLQDGRVLVSGSNPQQEPEFPEEYRVEVFIPPYLMGNPTIPTFTIAQKDWSYNQLVAFTLGGVPKGQIRVTLIALDASTHGNNMGQRTIVPDVQCTGTSCTVRAPPNGFTCPSGWFHMFVLDSGTPSKSAFVRIGGDPGQLGNWPQGLGFNLPGV